MFYHYLSILQNMTSIQQDLLLYMCKYQCAECWQELLSANLYVSPTWWWILQGLRRLCSPAGSTVLRWVHLQLQQHILDAQPGPYLQVQSQRRKAQSEGALKQKYQQSVLFWIKSLYKDLQIWNTLFLGFQLLSPFIFSAFVMQSSMYLNLKSGVSHYYKSNVHIPSVLYSRNRIKSLKLKDEFNQHDFP